MFEPLPAQHISDVLQDDLALRAFQAKQNQGLPTKPNSISFLLKLAVDIGQAYYQSSNQGQSEFAKFRAEFELYAGKRTVVARIMYHKDITYSLANLCMYPTFKHYLSSSIVDGWTKLDPMGWVMLFICTINQSINTSFSILKRFLMPPWSNTPNCGS